MAHTTSWRIKGCTLHSLEQLWTTRFEEWWWDRTAEHVRFWGTIRLMFLGEVQSHWGAGKNHGAWMQSPRRRRLRSKRMIWWCGEGYFSTSLLKRWGQQLWWRGVRKWSWVWNNLQHLNTSLRWWVFGALRSGSIWRRCMDWRNRALGVGWNCFQAYYVRWRPEVGPSWGWSEEKEGIYKGERLEASIALGTGIHERGGQTDSEADLQRRGEVEDGVLDGTCPSRARAFPTRLSDLPGSFSSGEDALQDGLCEGWCDELGRFGSISSGAWSSGRRKVHVDWILYLGQT